MYKICDRKYQQHRFIGDGVEITHLYTTLVKNKLVHSDYVLDFPFGINKAYMLVVDNSKIIKRLANNMAFLWFNGNTTRCL